MYINKKINLFNVNRIYLKISNISNNVFIINRIVAKHESEKQKLMKEINMLEVSNVEARVSV